MKSEETKEEIIEDIEKSGVSEEIAKKEEALDEKAQPESQEGVDEIAEDIEEAVEEEKVDEEGDVEKKTEEKKEAPKRRGRRNEKTRAEIIAAWDPKTELGQEVKDGKIKNINEILDNDKKILEPEIVDSLINVQSDLISIGQSKGKFGGGKRRAWRQTQRKTKEGNVATFSAMAVIGDENGHVGIGGGDAKETLPARDKAVRKAKLNVIKVNRTCAAFDCACSELHTIPFKVTGKCGSVRVVLIPAPQGTGLVVADQLKKILKLAGIKDVYSKTFGKQRTTFNLVKACIDALKKTNVEGRK